MQSPQQLVVELAQARNTMRAAAEELRAHWEAHCDANGLGPVNLERRLREGQPDCYGYCAGSVAQQRRGEWKLTLSALGRGLFIGWLATFTWHAVQCP